jgi:hypothetical protein
MTDRFSSDEIPVENETGSIGTFAGRFLLTIGWGGEFPPLVAFATRDLL